jgi:hypothetical protein
MRNTTDRRFASPVINADNRAVYGIIDGEPVFNPDYRWPEHLRMDVDSWVCPESDTIKTPYDNDLAY